VTTKPAPRTLATAFSEREAVVIQVARDLEDARSYWVAGGGSPLYAILLARGLGYAPNAQYLTEDGVIAPEPRLPFGPMGAMMSSRAAHRALGWGTMNTAGDHAQLGFIDYGILNTLQIDRHGNINSTVLGDYGESNLRFGGPGGAQTIAAHCWRTIVITDQQKRKFVDRVDFVSSPGYLDGTPGARERAGLPADTGPYRVYTPWAVYDYEDRELRLHARAAWVDVDQILAECDFRPRLAPEIEVLDPPADEELEYYRTRLDVRGQTMDRGDWVVRGDDGRYQRQAAGE
jgi:glutaconate CoA-transferase subunit B